jgi:mycofactocin glycosyltransferase
MIPFIYKLRDRIRFEDRGDSCLVVSEAPLNIIRASKRAVQILQRCDGKRTIGEITQDIGGVQEDQVFQICDYFNKKSALEISVTENQGYFPAISVIIPTRDRSKSAVECLESIYAQDYPTDRIEVIVIDDGSQDETQILISAFPCTLLTNAENHGQSYCRNLGVQAAKYEIIAFLDDDCVAGKTWLRDLAQFFRWEEIGAVGGYVDGYYHQSRLDRYEKEFSLLNLGKQIFRSTNDRFFIPTCNMLIRKKAYLEIGGIRETLHIGEDVDFCWRMRDAGQQMLYVPSGVVMHKHRNMLRTMLRRRADYGTSEAVLSALHPQKQKTLPWRPLASAAFLGLCCAIAFLSFLPLIITGMSFVAETTAKAVRLRKRIHLSLGTIGFSVLRTYLSYFYRMSFHIAHYYLVLILLLGFAFHSLWHIGFVLLILPASVDYSVKRPRLSFTFFFVYYVLDHISYQLGVLLGCLRAHSLRTYIIRLTHPLAAEL